MESAFWDVHGIFFIDLASWERQSYQHSGIIGLTEYRNQEKTATNAKEKSAVSLEQCPFHKSRKQWLNYQHPLYSPGLAPNDYWRFTDMFLGKKFASNEEVITKTESRERHRIITRALEWMYDSFKKVCCIFTTLLLQALQLEFRPFGHLQAIWWMKWNF